MDPINHAVWRNASVERALAVIHSRLSPKGQTLTVEEVIALARFPCFCGYLSLSL
jgi:hypothetical protein